MKRKKAASIIGKLLLSLAALAAGGGAMFLVIICSIFSLYGRWYVLFGFTGILFLISLLLCLIWGARKKIIVLPLTGIFVLCAAGLGGTYLYQQYEEKIPTVTDREDLLQEYAPERAHTKIVRLQETASLQLTENLPRLDGATALFPVYSAFACAVYPQTALKENERTDGRFPFDHPYLRCTSTSKAYERLIAGEADMIFVASASDKQSAAAVSAGVTLQYTPIGKEAFVFFVNSRNKVQNLTLEQIQDIYSGKITNWKQVGGKNQKIRAFQREEGSGSQTALQSLMKGRILSPAPQENIVDGMGGIIARTADYKNYKNAFGFSFRFYTQEMVKNQKIKLLSVNGIAPSRQTIADGTYPIASAFYAVTTQNSNPSCQALIEWILGEQGQYIINETGYVGIDQ